MSYYSDYTREDVAKTLGLYLRSCRESRGLTLEMLDALTGKRNGFWQKVEAGEIFVSNIDMELIYPVFEISQREVFDNVSFVRYF